MKAICIEGGHEEELHTENDFCLFRSPRKMAGGQKFVVGKDLFLHKTKAGNDVYYLIKWSVRSRKKEEIIQVTPGMAEKFLTERGIFCNTMSQEDQKAVATMQRYGWGILEEF